MKHVNQATFAKLHGVSRNTVTKWKMRGWLTFAGGFVDVDASNATLEKYRRKGVTQVTRSGDRLSTDVPSAVILSPAAMVDEPSSHVVERIALSAEHSLDEARRIKENYLALLYALHYEQESATVVLVEDAAAVVETSYAKVRSRLLAIPAQHAKRIHQLTTAVEVKDALWEVITRALRDLVQEAAQANGQKRR
jgi:phage terminase Nu1 subunit (DNA packaging protein)